MLVGWGWGVDVGGGGRGRDMIPANQIWDRQEGGGDSMHLHMKSHPPCAVRGTPAKHLLGHQL
jgi:hypothetical protein